MDSQTIRQKFLNFFKDRSHEIVESASLLPNNDATTLFTGSGMQPMVPYLLGEKHPLGTRIADSQRCFRAEDIEEVGDNRHTTFFEMLGNWSFGDFYKEDQLQWYFDFIVNEIGLDPQRLYVTCFAGDEKFNLPKDQDAANIWKKLFTEKGINAKEKHIGSEEDGYEQGMGDARIFYYDAKKNWWSRSGTPDKMPVGEPGGADSEVFFDFGTPHDPVFGEHCHPNCDCGRFIELGNNVFMAYKKVSEDSFEMLPNKNIDHGSGFERIVAASQWLEDKAKGEDCGFDIFNIDVFQAVMKKLHALSGKTYQFGQGEYDPAFRIVADHMRGAVFMIADQILPSNTGSGYITRRLIRRAVRFADTLGIPEGELGGLVSVITNFYKGGYIDVFSRLPENFIKNEIDKEEEKFRKTLRQGMAQFEKGERDAFTLFTTYGFPFEMTQELAHEKGETVDRELFEKKMKEHQESSRTAAAGMFKGGLSDHSDQVVKLHTAHHLLLAALQKHVSPDIKQKGSNITAERMRMDFSFDRKLTDEEKELVTNQVNEWIEQSLPVIRKEMPRQEAETIGAQMEFGAQYPDMVSVYFIGDIDNAVSKEFCGGPHAENTKELGQFKIKKEQSSSAGVRRIKAILI